MVTKKSKKSRKLRGSRTHGWGAGKKHRGAGNRGGRGRAGILGKRGSHRKTLLYIEAGKKYLPRKGGRIIRRRKEQKAINLALLEQKADTWLKSKRATSEKGFILLDFDKLGYQKLLGNGEVKRKFKIKVASISAGAKEKILKAGGLIEEVKG